MVGKGLRVFQLNYLPCQPLAVSLVSRARPCSIGMGNFGLEAEEVGQTSRAHSIQVTWLFIKLY